MKRSAREFALLCLPVIIIAGAGWWAMRRGAPDDNGIAVIEAHKVAVTPAVASKSGDVMARIRLEPNSAGFLRNSRATNWKTDLRVRAGERVVWREAENNNARKVLVWGIEAPNVDYMYEAGFDLKQVPANWGEVTLEWDAELQQSGRDLGRDWKRKSKRSGTIVLRDAGEIIAPPKVSTEPHLKLLSSEIKLTPPSSGAVFYQITLEFEPDSTLTNGELESIDFDFTLRNPKTKLVSGSYGSMGMPVGHSVYSGNYAHSYAYTVQAQHDVSDAKGLPNTKLNWKASSKTHWPLSGTLPITDAKGKILLGKKQYPQ